MADTGRTVWADGLWADDVWAVGLWATDEAVTVPDVDDTGTTQAAATAAIEGVGLVVSVLTAYSSSIPAGEVISQSPAAGSEVAPGSTVTITVSLGEAPAADQASTGGFLIEYERAAYARRKRQREIEEAQEAAKALQSDVDREIAELLQAKEAEQEFESNLTRLKSMVASFADREAEQAMTQRARKALAQAQAKESVSAFLRLQTELDRMLEEEEFAILMMLAND